MLISSTIIEPSSRKDDARQENTIRPSVSRDIVHPILTANDVMACRAHVEKVMLDHNVNTDVINGLLAMFDVALLGTVASGNNLPSRDLK